MKHNFNSKNLTIGLEAELQIINPRTQDLASCAKQLIRKINTSSFKHQIKPEITQSMIEINSSVHEMANSLENEMITISQYLKHIADEHNVVLCGGGTHPFQNWSARKIFPTSRFRELSKQYGYLAKRFTIFSMHVHISCNSANKAIYLTHGLSRFVSQFIALSASSPFYNGINTGYDSTRVNVVNAFPLSGHIPPVNNWAEFSSYFHKMQHLNVIESMKDFYWDIRPKPEYGTVEIRVCDMPLTIPRAVILAAYIQTVAYYILKEMPFPISADLYQLYDYNRFQASRFGYNGTFINPFTLKQSTIQNDILHILKLLEPYAKMIGTEHYLKTIKTLVKQKNNDATYLKNHYTKMNSLITTVRNKCKIWKHSLKH